MSVLLALFLIDPHVFETMCWKPVVSSLAIVGGASDVQQEIRPVSLEVLVVKDMQILVVPFDFFESVHIQRSLEGLQQRSLEQMGQDLVLKLRPVVHLKEDPI